MVFDVTLQIYLSSGRVFLRSTIHVHSNDKKLIEELLFKQWSLVEIYDEVDSISKNVF